jgi:hypothetical protein
MPTQHQVRVGLGLDRDQPQLFKTRALTAGERLVGELGQHRTPPQPQTRL